MIVTEKCPHCRATGLVREEDLGGYKAGECFNCRFDRSDCLPGPVEAAEKATEIVDAANKDEGGGVNSPAGVECLGAGWYQLPDRSKVRKTKLKELYPDWRGE